VCVCVCEKSDLTGPGTGRAYMTTGTTVRTPPHWHADMHAHSALDGQHPMRARGRPGAPPATIGILT
jgi:hypothetical protein